MSLSGAVNGLQELRNSEWAIDNWFINDFLSSTRMNPSRSYIQHPETHALARINLGYLRNFIFNILY